MVTIKQHDTGRQWTDTLTINGVPINVTGCTIALLIRRKVSPAVVRRSAVVVSGAAGTVSYQPVSDDVANAGVFYLEWEITFPGGAQLSVPSDGYIELTIQSDLA